MNSIIKENYLKITILLFIVCISVIFSGCGKKEILLVNQEKFTEPVGEITKNVSIMQSFVAEGNLVRVDILMATYIRTNDKDIFFQIKDDLNSSKDLVNLKINASKLKDNSWYSFEFKPIKIDKSKEYYIIITSPDSSPGNAVTIYSSSTDVYPDGELFINNQKTGKDIAFRIYGN